MKAGSLFSDDSNFCQADKKKKFEHPQSDSPLFITTIPRDSGSLSCPLRVLKTQSVDTEEKTNNHTHAVKPVTPF